MFESDNFLFQLQFMIGVVLNAVIVIQFALYWNTAAKVTPTAKGTAAKRDKNKME